MLRRLAVFALFLHAVVAWTASSAPTRVAPKPCLCKIDPAFRATRRNGINIGEVLYAKSFKDFPYIVDPHCPNLKILGVVETKLGMSSEKIPPIPCDTRAHRCPISDTSEGDHFLQLWCDDTGPDHRYQLSDTLIISVVHKGPFEMITKGPGDGSFFSDGKLNFSGIVDDRIRDGPPIIFADFRLSDPRDPSVVLSTRIYAQSVPQVHDYYGGVDWTITADFGRLGLRRVTSSIVAEDGLGNRTSLDISKSTTPKSFTINMPPPEVSISTPAAGQPIGPRNGISGFVVDSLGLRQIALTVYEGNGHQSMPSPVAVRKFAVSGTRARFSYSEIRDEDLRYGASYVIAVAVTNGLGHEFSPVQTVFTYSYRDENLAIISDKKRSVYETIRAIDAVPTMSTIPARAIDTLIDAMYGRGDDIGYSAATALIRIGRPAIPRIATRWYLGNGTQLPYMMRVMSGMPADLQRELIPSITKAFHDLVWERRMAAEALGMLNHAGKEALPLLLEALHDPDADVRALAAQSIANLHLRADAAAAVPGLVAMLHHENLAERMWATRALQDIGEPSRESLIPLLDDVSTQTVTFAAIALASISSANMVGEIPVFEKALRDGSQPVRYMTLEAMTAMGGAARHAAPKIVAALRDADPAVRSAAVQAVFAVDPDSDESRKALESALADASLQSKIAWELGRRGASSAWAAPTLAQAFLRAPGCFRNPSANDLARFLPKIGVASVPPLIDVLRQGAKCQRVAAAWALGEIGPAARGASPALLEFVDSPDPDLSKQVAGSLDKIDPGWFRKRMPPEPAAPADGVATEIEPASIKNEIVPFLIEELASSKPGRSDEALLDLAYLRSQAGAALPALRLLGASRRSYEKAGVAQAVRLIMGENPTPAKTNLDVLALPMVNLREVGNQPKFPVVSDITLKLVSQQAQFHVGGPVELEFEIETTTNRKYISQYPAHRILSAVRIDSDGVSHPVDVPVTSLYRGAYSLDGIRSGPSELDASHPAKEGEELNYRYILDHPGKYRLIVDSVFDLRVSSGANRSKGIQSGKSDPTTDIMREYFNSTKFVRSKSIVVEFELLPRDQDASDRRLWELTADVMRIKNWEGDWRSSEQMLGYLLDYRAIPALLHVVEVAGDSTTTGGAVKALSYLCDKKRLRDEILLDVDKNKRPHNEDEAKTLAGVLAAAETIPCRPEMSKSDEDYVRWDVARMRWEDRMMGRLGGRGR